MPKVQEGREFIHLIDLCPNCKHCKHLISPFPEGIRIHIMTPSIIVLFSILYKGSDKRATSEYRIACSGYGTQLGGENSSPDPSQAFEWQCLTSRLCAVSGENCKVDYCHASLWELFISHYKAFLTTRWSSEPLQLPYFQVFFTSAFPLCIFCLLKVVPSKGKKVNSLFLIFKKFTQRKYMFYRMEYVLFCPLSDMVVPH